MENAETIKIKINTEFPWLIREVGKNGGIGVKTYNEADALARDWPASCEIWGPSLSEPHEYPVLWKTVVKTVPTKNGSFDGNPKDGVDGRQKTESEIAETGA